MAEDGGDFMGRIDSETGSKRFLATHECYDGIHNIYRDRAVLVCHKSSDLRLAKGRPMMTLTYQSNDSCFAVYLDGRLIAWGSHGDDPVRAMKAAGEVVGFKVEHGRLPDLCGGAPQERIPRDDEYECKICKFKTIYHYKMNFHLKDDHGHNEGDSVKKFSIPPKR